jgi:triphosphoribosyl-dephospho-CoA synthetase
MATFLLISGLAAIAAANAAWWWYRDRAQQARIRRLTVERDHARLWRAFWHRRALLAEQARAETAGKASSLAERNRMLTDLIGDT